LLRHTSPPSKTFVPIISAGTALGSPSWHDLSMVRYVCSVLTLRTTDLWRIATALKAGVQPASNHRRIQRFLAGYDLDMVALGRLLMHLVQTSPPYLITTEYDLPQVQALMKDPDVSTAQICERFDVSKATLYRYVGPDGKSRN
jgi:hypothetical protein